MKNFKLSFVIALSVLHFSCNKKGPAGPVGPQGPVGTANVIYSPWFLSGTDWDTTLSAPYGAVAAFDKAAPSIHSRSCSHALLLFLIKNNFPNSIFLLWLI